MTRDEQHQAALADEQQVLAIAARRGLKKFLAETRATPKEKETLEELFARWKRSGHAQRCLQVADELHQAALFASMEGSVQVPGWHDRPSLREWTKAVDEIKALSPLARHVAGIEKGYLKILERERARLRRPKKGEAGRKTWRGVFQESAAMTANPPVPRRAVRLMRDMLKRLAAPPTERFG